MKMISLTRLDTDDDDVNDSGVSTTPARVRARKLSMCRQALTSEQRLAQRRISFIGTSKRPDSEPSEAISALGTTRIQRLVTDMRECLAALDCRASCQVLESWACCVYESMSAPSRTFHSVQHVFDVAIGGEPIQKLAAFYHDIVYYSIDGGLNDTQSKNLCDVITVADDGVVAITVKEFDRNTAMTMDIFGFECGKILDPFKGLNEFLSAVLAVRSYEGHMKPFHLAQIAACIEATIPFRHPDETGLRPEEALFSRLEKVNEKYDLGMEEEEIVLTVQLAADLGNRDLANFSTPERAVFLSNTWNLLPESNISLRNTTVFRISDFAFALKKMTGFFQFLDPEVIYLTFREPKKEVLIARKTEIARANIEVALRYMHCKRLSIAVVAAIAELSGGDAPLALFLGDLPERHHISTSIEDHIYVDLPEEGVHLDIRVFELLNDGRESESKFDIKNSPLAAYLYSLIGDEGLNKCLEYAVHPMDEGNARALLKSLPPVATTTIVEACAEIAITRKDALQKIIQFINVV